MAAPTSVCRRRRRSIVDFDGLFEIVVPRALWRLVHVLQAQPGDGRRPCGGTASQTSPLPDSGDTWRRTAAAVLTDYILLITD